MTINELVRQWNALDQEECRGPECEPSDEMLSRQADAEPAAAGAHLLGGVVLAGATPGVNKFSCGRLEHFEIERVCALVNHQCVHIGQSIYFGR